MLPGSVLLYLTLFSLVIGVSLWNCDLFVVSRLEKGRTKYSWHKQISQAARLCFCQSRRKEEQAEECFHPKSSTGCFRLPCMPTLVRKGQPTPPRGHPWQVTRPKERFTIQDTWITVLCILLLYLSSPKRHPSLLSHKSSFILYSRSIFIYVFIYPLFFLSGKLKPANKMREGKKISMPSPGSSPPATYTVLLASPLNPSRPPAATSNSWDMKVDPCASWYPPHC